jgi:hypothetical protein
MQWLGKKVSIAVWRKILTEHAALIDLFQPGNEANLQQACRNHPELDQAIKRFGPPSPELLSSIMNGSSSTMGGVRAGATMPYNAARALSHKQLEEFVGNGFVVLRDAVPQTLLDTALQHINGRVGVVRQKCRVRGTCFRHLSCCSVV